MRMRTEFAHAERKRWRSAAGMATLKGHKRLLTCSNRQVRQLGRRSERCSENPFEKEEKNLDVSSKREPAEAPGEISPYPSTAASAS
jgi:hypothetical protein